MNTSADFRLSCVCFLAALCSCHVCIRANCVRSVQGFAYSHSVISDVTEVLRITQPFS